MSKTRVVVTGGAGFIGSELVRHLVSTNEYIVLNVDSLTYAGHLGSLRSIEDNSNYHFAKVDIRQKEATKKAIYDFEPQAILHLAAESHVDRSIDGPEEFILTNIVGTYNLLEISRSYLQRLDLKEKSKFRFVTVSTDEVYGSLGPTGKFKETTPYDPSSPYSASKASADHLTKAWCRTFGLPTIVTNCSNNYGPYQYPEKLIPLTIQKMIQEQPIPIYGNGTNIRDWLYVADHILGLERILTEGEVGETYNIGGDAERTNLEVVTTLCGVMDELRPRSAGQKYSELISFVKDRPGHDFRYAIDATKIQRELKWKPITRFEDGILKTVRWYLENSAWVEEVQKRMYAGQRLGVGGNK